MGNMVLHGVYAGLPKRIATLLRRNGMYTRAAVRDWYRADPLHAGARRGLGAGSVALIGFWLGDGSSDPARLSDAKVESRTSAQAG